MKNYTFAQDIFDMALLHGTASLSNQADYMDELSWVYYNMWMCQSFLNNPIESNWFPIDIKWIDLFLSNKVVINWEYILLAFNDEFNDFENAITMFEKVLALDNSIWQAYDEISMILLRLDYQFTLERSKELFW